MLRLDAPPALPTDTGRRQPERRSPPEPSPRNPAAPRFRPRIAQAVLVGFLIRAAIGLTDDVVATDETAYLRSGLSLVGGDGFQRYGRPELHFPPFIPLLLGLTGRLFADPHTATVGLTILAGTAAIVPLALLARRLGGPRAGVITAWLAAATPGLSTLLVTRGAGSEAEYLLLVVGAVALVASSADDPGRSARVTVSPDDPGRSAPVTASPDDPGRSAPVAGSADRPGRGGLVRVAGAGGLVGLAYLARPEGLFLAVPLAIAVVAVRGLRPRAVAATALAFLVPLALCLVPYAAYQHRHTGHWQLTAKTQDASLEAWRQGVRHDREARDRELYALDDSGLHFTAGRTPLTQLARQDPQGYLGIVGANLQSLLGAAVDWTLLAPLIWLAVGAAAWRHRRSGTVRLLVAVGAVPVVTTVFFFVQPRYLVVTVAMGTVLAGVALAEVGPRRRALVGGVTALCLVVPLVLAFLGPSGWGRPVEYTDQKAVGQWLADHTEPGDVIMSRSFIVEHYADRPMLPIPYADLDQILVFGRHYGARYLVVDAFTVTRLRTQLAFLGQPELEVPPGLRLVHEVTSEGRIARVFALDPAPPSNPAGLADAPALAFVGDGSTG